MECETPTYNQTHKQPFWEPGGCWKFERGWQDRNHSILVLQEPYEEEVGRLFTSEEAECTKRRAGRKKVRRRMLRQRHRGRMQMS